MFSHVECPAVLVDAQQRIVANNRRGLELLGEQTFVSQVDGRLICVDEASQIALQTIIATGSSAAGSVCSTSIHLPKSSAAVRAMVRQIGVTVIKLMPAGVGLTAQRLAASGELTLLLFQNVPVSPIDFTASAMDSFGLTKAQARVASELMSGKTIKQIAFYLGVSVNTVRHHVKAIFAKTRTNRQVALVQVLGRFAQSGVFNDLSSPIGKASNIGVNTSAGRLVASVSSRYEQTCRTD